MITLSIFLDCPTTQRLPKLPIVQPFRNEHLVKFAYAVCIKYTFVLFDPNVGRLTWPFKKL
jgi:hypothetical protein